MVPYMEPFYTLKKLLGPNNFRTFSQATCVSVGDMQAMFNPKNTSIIVIKALEFVIHSKVPLQTIFHATIKLL